jgi:hypothetical protein
MGLGTAALETLIADLPSRRHGLAHVIQISALGQRCKRVENQ